MKTAHMFYFFTRKNNLKDIYYCNIHAISYSKSKKNWQHGRRFFLGNKKKLQLIVIFLMTVS